MDVIFNTKIFMSINIYVDVKILFYISFLLLSEKLLQIQWLKKRLCSEISERKTGTEGSQF